MTEVLDKFKKEYTGNLNIETHKTHKKLARLVEFYIKCYGNITKTCQTANVARRTFYDYKEKYPEFVKALEDAEQEICDNVEAMFLERDVILSRNFEGRRFWLQSRHKAYKPKQELEIPEGFNINIKMVEPNEQGSISK